MRTAITIAHHHDGTERILFSTDIPVHEQKETIRGLLVVRSKNPVHQEWAWVRYQELDTNWTGGEARVIPFDKPSIAADKPKSSRKSAQ